VDLRELLETDGDDSLLEVVEYNASTIRFSVTVDALGGEIHEIAMTEPVHVDMPPKVMLGKVAFGAHSLLPNSYLETRNRGNEGDEGNWRVMHVVDDEGNTFFVVAYGREAIE
jgi:hypothetical protein